MTHELKIYPKWFADVASGKKNFEVRRYDRDYSVGDELVLKEWTKKGGYTGRTVIRTIEYILGGDAAYGIDEEYCVLGLKELCEDCISRESVKKLLREEWVKFMPMEYDPYLANVMPMLDDLPSVKPKRAKGKWIDVDAVSNKGICSNCGSKGYAYYNFCPYCGADTRKE